VSRLRCVAFLLCLINPFLNSETWKSFTAMNDVRGIVRLNNFLWVGTSGGIYSLNENDSTVIKYTNADGLSSNDVTAIGKDKNGLIWVGSSSGTIDVFSPITKLWFTIRDIALSQKTQKVINKFYNVGDTMYIATGFGISLYSISRKEFLDTFNSFGSFGETVVYDVTQFNQRLLLATEKGIAYSKINATNLSAPESWETRQDKSTSLSIFNSTLYAATINGVFSFTNNQWNVVTGLTQLTLKLVASDDAMFLLQQNEVKQINRNGIISTYGTTYFFAITDAILASQNNLLIGFQGRGIASFKNQSWLTYSPNGPVSNNFSSVVIDHDGEIWATSGRNSGFGFYRFNGTSWYNYSTYTDPILKYNDFFAITVSPTNEKLVSSWGAGIALVSKEGKVLRMFDNKNPGLVGVENANYVVSGSVAFDKENNLWVSLYRSSSLDILWKMKPDSQWTSYKAPQSNNYVNVLGLFVDANGTKWFTNTLPGFTPSPAFVYFNENKNIAGTSDNWGSLLESDGLTSLQITSIAGGKDGDIWVGTTSGISIINNPLTPSKNISKLFLGALRDQMIQCIIVDGVNNKWVGTPQGIYCVTPDGSTLLEHYNTTTTNGKLVGNNILSLAVDNKNGIIYAGTDKGLSSFTIPFVTPKEKMETISISPQPFLIPSTTNITISGLSENCLIKILTSTGVLITQFDAQGGGRGFWDGKDNKGNYVSSGIYFAIAYSQQGGEIGIAKIAIVRQ